MDDEIGHELSVFNFSRLFRETLGWDRHRGSWPIRVIEQGQHTAYSVLQDDLVQQTFTMQAIAQKKGVQILHCQPAADGKIPNYPTRCRIQHQVVKLARENVVIFTNQSQTHQIWQWVRRATGELPQHCEHHFRKPASTVEQSPGEDEQEETSEYDSDTEPLAQRLRHLFFSIDDDEKGVSLMEVVQRLRRAFYNYRNTNRRGPYSRVRLYEYDVAEMDPAVQFWVEQVYAEPRLSRSEEFEIARKMAMGNEIARDKFIRANLYIVAEIAWRITVDNDLSDDDFLDLVQRGNIILVRLVDKFNYKYGARFQGFASLLIASRLSAAGTASTFFCYLPRYQEERLPQMLQVWNEVEDSTIQRLGRQPTDAEIAIEVAPRVSLSTKWVLHLLRMTAPASSWEAVREEWESREDEEAERPTLMRKELSFLFMNESQAPSDAALNLVRREQLDIILNGLTPRERDVIRMRFGFDDGKVRTLEEVGQRFAVTRERVRQIELRALKKLRRMGPANFGRKPELANLKQVKAATVEDSRGDAEALDESDADSAI